MNALSRPQAPLHAGEVQGAIDQLLARLALIHAACGEAFPLYCRGLEQPWKVSAGGSWLGGFWAGLWWLRAFCSGADHDRQQAEQISQRLADKLDSDSHHRSLIFWYGAGLGARLLGSEPGTELARQARQRLALAFDPLLGAIPLGRDMGGGEQGDQCLSIDPLAATLRLLAVGAEPRAQFVPRLCRAGRGLEQSWALRPGAVAGRRCAGQLVPGPGLGHARTGGGRRALRRAIHCRCPARSRVLVAQPSVGRADQSTV